MKKIVFIPVILLLQFAYAQKEKFFIVNTDSTDWSLTLAGASHLASLPLKCLLQEYPNKTSHTATSDSDQLMTPRQMHPAFFGCFDWHSCVHGYWMLTRLLKLYPQMTEAGRIREIFNKQLTPQNITLEIRYLDGKLSKAFERTYGWAWLLKLHQELNGFDDADARNWKKNLQPLVDKVIVLWKQFLPKQTYPNRTGVHPNTAFGLVFALDYARALKDTSFEMAVTRSAIQLFYTDKIAPANWEPDGTDFLSPSLEEADLMRRVLSKTDFIHWFNAFYPGNALEHLTHLPQVSDRTDLQIVHLDGLCFSRSWCMKNIAALLPANDKRKMLLLHAAIKHLGASLPHIASGEYGGEHWLASFAVYALAN